MKTVVDKGKILLTIAREAIAERFGLIDDAQALDEPPWLWEQAATFVTLTIDGSLRGCIGTLEAYRPLVDDLRANARSAAFEDPRFAPLSESEFHLSRLEVSLLTPIEPMSAHGEDAVAVKLRPHIDGVVLRYGNHGATFLPQVWSQLPEPGQFLAHLKAKAGLPPDFWHEGLLLFTYQVEKYCERDMVEAI